MLAADDTSRARIRSEIDRGRPLIALIEVGPQAYHYVVIVGSTDQEVVLHDPARAPFRVLRWAEFDRAWAATGRWMLLVLPPGGIRPGADEVRAAPASPEPRGHAAQTPCGALVERGVDMALAGDGEGAGQALVAATRLCPGDADVVAGVGGVAIFAGALDRGPRSGAIRRSPCARRPVRVAARRHQSIPDGRRDGGARRVEPHGRAAPRHHRHSRRRPDAAAGCRSGRRAAAPAGADARSVRAGAAPAACAAGRLERADEVRTHRWRARQARGLHRRAPGGAERVADDRDDGRARAPGPRTASRRGRAPGRG